jgi:magnesium transporter
MNSKEQKLEAFSKLLDIMDDLREKCPWDKKQDLQSLRHLTLEEVYELSDALLEENLTEIKKELGRSIRNEDLLRLMKLQKTLVYFNTSIRGNEVMVGKLQSIFQEKDYQNRDLVEDVVIELKQAYNTVNIYSDILTGTMDAFASIISNNVNTIMKRMTSISIILMVPTLIASFYGMNVDVHVDALPHAFSFIILASITLSALAFVIFRKIKWF